MAVREEDLGSIIGPQGPQGIQGEVGPTGAKGDQGANGATWITGTSAPSTQGVNGDYYLNTSNWDVYQKLSGTWTKKGNIQGGKGDKGDQGATGAQGAKGDPFAIAKTYTSISAMNSGYISDGVGVGQFVVIDTGNVEDTDNAKLYLKGASSYTYITDMSGATGLTGPQGPKGATGATGATGPKGDKGDPGVTPSLVLRDGHLIAVYQE